MCCSYSYLNTGFHWAILLLHGLGEMDLFTFGFWMNLLNLYNLLFYFLLNNFLGGRRNRLVLILLSLLADHDKCLTLILAGLVKICTLNFECL